MIVDGKVYKVETVSADTGYFSEETVKEVEKRDEEGKAQGPEVYRAVEKQSHHRTVKDLEKREEPPEPAAGATVREEMARRLKTEEDRKIYKKRKETVEWELVCLSYNMKRLFQRSQG
jgi:hypothetical protein